MSSLKILYEDNHIIAVVKPAGLLTQGDRSGDPSLMDEVRNYLMEKKNKKTPSNPSGQAGNVFLGLVHRLDKPVQGIVLFGKTSKGASSLSEQFREHTIQKTYHAIVVGKLDKQKGEIKEKVNKISFFAEGFTDKSDEELLAEIKKATKTRTAELSWEVVKYIEKPDKSALRILTGPSQSRKASLVGYSLLKILPKTGRFHQIRIQVANMGHPIVGDVKYGGSVSAAASAWQSRNSIALSATAISFKSATEDKQINLEIPLPEEWKKFI